MPNPSHDEQAATSTNLPAITPSTAALIHRTQTTLGLLRDVVQESSAEHWYERGKEANTKQNWEEAVLAFKTCMARNSDHWRAVLQLTYALVQQRNIAVPTLLQSYNLPYLDWESWVAELPIDRWHLLRAHLEFYKDVAQDGFGASMALAVVYRAVGEFKLARFTLDDMWTSYSIQIQESSAWYRLSGSLRDAATRDGIYEVERETELDFEQAATLATTAADYFSLGVAEEEFEWKRYWYFHPDKYEKAIQLNENHSYAIYKIGHAYAACDKLYEKSIEFFNRAIKIKPDFLEAYLERGQSKICVNDFEGGLNDFNRAIEIYPLSIDAYLARKNLFAYELKDYDAAIANSTHLINISPNSAEYYTERAYLKKQIKDYSGAIVDYSKAIEIEPENPYNYQGRREVKLVCKGMNGFIDYPSAYEDLLKFRYFHDILIAKKKIAN